MRQTTAMLICFLGLLMTTGCMYPGMQNWTHSQQTDTQRDQEYQSCVNIHVYQHGANEGLTRTRDYTYRPEAAVWDCMADRGYA